MDYVQKTAQKQPEIVLCAGMKTFEIAKLENYVINFIRILWFIWDLVLVLFDSHKDLVFGKNFGFNILGFLGVNWAQKWTRTINFGYIMFPLKQLILKDCSETAFVLWKMYLWSNFSKRESYLREEWPKNSPKAPLDCHENIWKFKTWQPKMLH